MGNGKLFIAYDTPNKQLRFVTNTSAGMGLIKCGNAVIPFEIGLETPNAETLEALREAEIIGRDPNTKRYSSFSELLQEVKDEV